VTKTDTNDGDFACSEPNSTIQAIEKTRSAVVSTRSAVVSTRSAVVFPIPQYKKILLAKSCEEDLNIKPRI